MENSGIMYTIIYRRVAAVFPYFSGKRQQRGKYLKMRKSAHKKRALQHDNAQEENLSKKRVS